jgi:TonB-dependent receptor
MNRPTIAAPRPTHRLSPMATAATLFVATGAALLPGLPAQAQTASAPSPAPSPSPAPASSPAPTPASATSPAPRPAAAAPAPAAGGGVQTIVITGGQRGATAKAKAEERGATQTVSVISADEAGQFGDQNAAEALARLPGVNVVRDEGEGRGVSIRGLPPSFTQVTLNGTRLGNSGSLGQGPVSGDNDGNGVLLDILGPDSLAQLAVFKTYTADMDGDTIGGAVDLRAASAFDSAKPVLTGRLEASYGEYAGKVNPKASLNFSRQLVPGVWGLSGGLSYFKRKINGDQVRNETGIAAVTFNNTTPPAAGVTPFNNSGKRFFFPNILNPRVEAGERERTSFNLGLEWRPGQGQRYFLRGQYSKLEDLDIRIEEQYNIDRAGGISGNSPTANSVEILESDTGPGFGVFKDVRYRNRIFFQPSSDTLTVLSAGGRNELGANTRLDWQLDRSRSQFELKDGVRGRWEIDDVATRATWGEDFVTMERSRWTPRFAAGSANDPALLSNYRFNALQAVQEEREDRILGFKADLTHALQLGQREITLKGGFKLRDRDNQSDRTLWDTVGGGPSLATAGIANNLSQLPLATPPNNYNQFGPIADRSAAREFLLNARNTLLAFPSFLRPADSVGRDYKIGERVEAFYGMATFEPAEKMEISAGARYERTRLSAQGFYYESEADGDLLGGQSIYRSGDLGTTSRSYGNLLPSAVLRWEPRKDLVARASYGRGIKRADFKEVTNRLQINTNVDGGVVVARELEAGNPRLKPMVADQFDLGLAWYPSRNTALQASLFHKDIEDFHLRFIGSGPGALATAGIALPAELSATTPAPITQVRTVLNGGKASISGLELSYSQNYVGLPGLLSGLFAQANVTFLRSRADVAFRLGERLPFPEQPDLTANVSLGWENDQVSMRVSANHTGKRLFTVSETPNVPSAAAFNGGSAWFPDVYRASYTQIDLNLRWNISKTLQLYLDGTNLTSEKEYRYYATAGKAPGLDTNFHERIEDFGPTYQVGLRIKF